MRSFQGPKQVLTILLLSSSLLPSALAARTPSPTEYCVYGCNQATSYVGFAGADPLDFYGTQCSNKLYVQSLYYCIQQYCSEEEAKAGLDLQDEVCFTNAGVHLPDYDDYVLSPEDLAAVKIADATVSAGSLLAPLDYPVIVAELSFQLAYRTTSAHFNNRRLGFTFAWAMYGFWGLVALIGVGNRCAEWLAMRRHTAGSYRADSKGLRLWVRKILLLPATFGNHCQEPIGWCTIPPRLESVLLILYLVMNFIFMFPGYDFFVGNLWYPTYELQYSRYIGLRAGILTVSQLPVVWVFAARNDPLLWLTGWSFATYNRFHRWVARLCLLLAFTHATCFSIYTWKSGAGLIDYYTTSWLLEYWYCGAIGVVMISALVGSSFYIFRVKWYNLFLVVHIALSVVLLVVIWYHVTAFGTDASGFIWTCVAMWAFDRVLRIARTIYLFKGLKATATYDRSADIIRLNVTDLLPSKEITPGLYYYLYAPGNIRGYESHPFTLCSWRRGVSSSEQADASDKSLPQDTESPATRPSTTTAGSETLHSLLIRPYAGFTGRLRDQLLASSPDASAQVTVLLEGPYGQKTDLRAFSDVLVIAGGNGITSAISHSTLLLPTQTTSVHVVWAVQDVRFVDHVCRHELRAALGDAHFDLTVYQTRSASAADTAAEKTASPSGTTSSSYAVNYGRPDIKATVAEARSNSAKNLAVVVCGPPRLADDVRTAVVQALGESGPSVEFYNEAHYW